MKRMITAVLTGILFLSLNRTYAQFDSASGGSFSDRLTNGAGSIPVPQPKKVSQPDDPCTWELSLQTGELLNISAGPIAKNLELYFPGRGLVRYSALSPTQWYPKTNFGLDVSPLAMETKDDPNRPLNAWARLKGSVLGANDTILDNGTSFRKSHLKVQAITTVRLHVEMADANKCPAARVFAKYSGSGSARSRAYAGNGCRATNKIKIAGSLSGDHAYTMMPGHSNHSSDRVDTKVELRSIKTPSIPVIGGEVELDDSGLTINLAGIKVGADTEREMTQSGDLRISGVTEESAEELPYAVIWNSLLDIEMSAVTKGKMSEVALALADARVTHRIDSFKGVLPNTRGKYNTNAEDFSLEMLPLEKDYFYDTVVCDLPLLIKAGKINQKICVNSFPENRGSNPVKAPQINLRQRFLLKIAKTGLEIKIMDKGVRVKPVSGVIVTMP